MKVPLCDSCDSQSEVAVSSDGKRAFVSHPGANVVSIIDYSGAGAVPTVTTVAVMSPFTIATSADGSTTVVYGSTGRVSVIDSSTPEPTVAMVPEYFNSYRGEGFIALSTDGRRAWVTNHDGSSPVVAIDTSNPTDPVVLFRSDLNDWPHSIATTADGTRAYVVAHDHFWVLDTRSGNLKESRANMPADITYNNASENQQVAVSGRGDVVVATSINGHFVALNASAF